jgi:hypothetical protein
MSSSHSELDNALLELHAVVAARVVRIQERATGQHKHDPSSGKKVTSSARHVGNSPAHDEPPIRLEPIRKHYGWFWRLFRRN